MIDKKPAEIAYAHALALHQVFTVSFTENELTNKIAFDKTIEPSTPLWLFEYGWTISVSNTPGSVSSLIFPFNRPFFVNERVEANGKIELDVRFLPLNLTNAETTINRRLNLDTGVVETFKAVSVKQVRYSASLGNPPPHQLAATRKYTLEFYAL